tara:strand:+ start:558 stop:872 length:315 start_codon:yes stop_codon:yes gene_type:complete
MKIFVDIDETIFNTKKTDYNSSKPIKKNIDIVNKLYDEGHHITMWTARGAVSGIDWRVLTEQQLKDFGVKYHELRLDKPFFDIFVDDKTFNSLDFFDDPKSFIK